MYITKGSDCDREENFDWQQYFSSNGSIGIREQQDILVNVRELLQENKFQLVLSFNTIMKNLLTGLNINKPQVLELGAATGVLTRWLMSQYGGNGVLVDRNKSSYDAYCAIKDDTKKNITYIVQDIFELELEEQYDVVCSFGLIEHFKEKTEILRFHNKFLKENGIIIISVPLDSKLSRVFFEVHPELNLGYRELLTERELVNILNAAGLKVVKSEISNGYSYDFLAVACMNYGNN